MKWYQVLALAASVGLAGCALPPDQSSDDAPATTPTMPRAGDMPAVTVSELQGAPVQSIEVPADLWDRIRRGFAMPDLEGELVARHEEWYSTRPDYIERMVDRSRLYIFHIVEELELRGMPTELALLPYIESAFNPQAVSSAKAAGMWQFMPGTGRDFQLRQTMFRDDRRNVLESTRAALDYLQMLHDMFDDWHLALAAYNWGQGSVKRAIERNQAAGLGTSYEELNMPDETRNYVPKLQAVKNIIANPQQFGNVLPLIENHPFFDTVEITRDMDVEVAARLAEVRLEDFKALNPSQRKPVIFAAGTPQILLPWNNADVFKKNLAATAPGALASWTAWVAPSNLPSREVASRFGMDEVDFRAMNNIPRGMLIKSGSTVLVRRNGQGGDPVAEHVVNNARLAYTPEVVLRRTTVRARSGDSIARIAARYDLPAATVAGWNKKSARAGLKRGQPVVLYLPVRASAARAASTAPKRATPARATKGQAKRATPAAKGRAQPASARKAPAKRAPAAKKSTAKKPAARKPAAKPAAKGKAKR